MQLKLIESNQIIDNHMIKIDFDKNLNYLKNISLLITDWSGISLEYYSIEQGNIIFVDTPKEEKKYEIKRKKLRVD